MIKKLAILMIAVLSLTVGACSQANNTKEETKENTQNNTQTAKNFDVGQISDQWATSGHAKSVGESDPSTAPGLNEQGGCFACHNGLAFETKADKLDGIGILKGQSCDTCHTGHGRDLVKSGTVENALGKIDGGKGSLCMACHFGRGKKPDQKSAPHHSVQTDMLWSKSGAEVQGVQYNTSPHKNNPDVCLACHMAADKNGVRDHTFKMVEANIANSCDKCHDFKNFNPPAKGDYDGNGQKEGIQTEVDGLLKLVEKAINDKLNGGKFVSSHGAVEFQDASGKALAAPPSPELYNAAWNYFFVTNDGSKGVHNPGYAVQLLQQSYKAVTGNDVPKAEIRK